MTENLLPPKSPLSEAEATQLIEQLHHKEGTWVDWGHACQQLQGAGYAPQKIFEDTGFQPVHQNQVIVAAQVYDSIVTVGTAEAVRSHYATTGSDVLYELRVLPQQQRAEAAALLLDKRGDAVEAREVVKAVREFARLPKVPEGFSTHPGDAVAYQCWKQARQKKDLQERSRLIAKALKFVESPTARTQVEQLLSDFTVVPIRQVPLLPLYRLESEEELPRLVPFAGNLPLTGDRIRSLPTATLQEPFNTVAFSQAVTCVALPGWQAILNATDPIALQCYSDELPVEVPGNREVLLAVVDRAACEWDAGSYFLAERDGAIAFYWFEEAPELPLLGRVIVLLRPKRLLPEDAVVESSWTLEE